MLQSRMPKKKNDISPDDLALFHQAMKDAKPFTASDKVRLTPPSSRPRQKIPKDSTFEEKFHLSDTNREPEVTGEAFITFKQSDISNKNLRKLRKGQYNVQAVLDLHGMTVEEAMTAVENFLQQCLQEGIRVVLIIHGKGHHSHQSPILKNKLNNWLREINFVLAFSSAAPQHGSRGAMYVLLKKSIS